LESRTVIYAQVYSGMEVRQKCSSEIRGGMSKLCERDEQMEMRKASCGNATDIHDGIKHADRHDLSMNRSTTTVGNGSKAIRVRGSISIERSTIIKSPSTEMCRRVGRVEGMISLLLVLYRLGGVTLPNRQLSTFAHRHCLFASAYSNKHNEDIVAPCQQANETTVDSIHLYRAKR